MTESTIADQAFSYLEFGSIDLAGCKKEVWDFRLGDKAYDWLMCARYLNDMLGYIKLAEGLGRLGETELCSIYSQEIHHRNDASVNLGKLIALWCAASPPADGERPVFFAELGSTLFGCIEGLLFCERLLSHYRVDCPRHCLDEVRWLGVDISDMFNRLAGLLHPGHDIHTMTHFDDLPPELGVFFAKGVSLLYAIRAPQQLFSLVDRARICIFDYSFSMNGDQATTIGTGKHVRYLDYYTFSAMLGNSNKKAFVRKNKSYYTKDTNRIFVDLVLAEQPVAQAYVALDTRMRTALRERFEARESVGVLLDLGPNEQVEWIALEQFVDSIQLANSGERLS